MDISKKLYLGLMLVCLLLPSLAHAEKILDKTEIIKTETEAEIHIEFLVQVRYLRHTPTEEADRIRIFLEIPQGNRLNPEREFLTSPPTDLVPGFTVNYPDQKTQSIGVTFKKPIKVFRVTPDNSGRGIVIHVPLEKLVTPLEPEVKAPTPPVAETAVIEVPAIPAGMSVNDYAGKLVGDSRVAMGLGDYSKAIELLNAALNIPSHDHSQEAQELIGIAREKNGELTKAKAEYELYLKLYPESEGASRVRERIAAIDTAAKVSGIDAVKEKKVIKDIHETTVFGNWNQYYYDAHSHNYPPGPAKNSHSHDQSQLVSNIDLTARSRQNQYDSKIVLRDVQTMDALPGESHTNTNQTLTAYVQVENKEIDYLIRAGRQSGNSGGVLGRFDGAWLRYGISPKYRINLVAGSLDDSTARDDVDYKRPFYGVSLDIGPLAEKWSGNVFFINQKVDNLTDRRAVGAELRYFDNGRSFYSLLDYDTYFDRLNIAMFQGNWQTEGGTNYNMLIDHRMSPILQSINSLPAYFALGVTTLKQAMREGLVTESQIQKDALALTLITDAYLIGATRQITPRWQLGADYQINFSSGTQAAGVVATANAIKAAEDAGLPTDTFALTGIPSSAGAGHVYTYHAQAIGLDTLFKDDTSVISVTYTTGQISQVQSLVLSNVVVPRENWRIDSSLKLTRVDSEPSVVSKVVSPTILASYRFREKATLEAEISLEWVNTDDSFGHTRTFSDFSFIGYRLDF